MARASLERQLVAAQTAKLELETKLREKESRIDVLESDRLYLSEEGKKYKEELERETGSWEAQKVRSYFTQHRNVVLPPLTDIHVILHDASATQYITSISL